MAELRKGTRAEFRAEVEVVQSGDVVTVSIPGVTHRLIVPPEMLTPLFDPEPSVGSVVVDCDGYAWQRKQPGWVMAGAADLQTWYELNSDYGPLHIVYTPEERADG